MQLPDPSKHNPAPEYIRGLLTRIGVSQRKAAHVMGIGERMMRYYVTESSEHRPIPYATQYALECWAGLVEKA